MPFPALLGPALGAVSGGAGGGGGAGGLPGIPGSPLSALAGGGETSSAEGKTEITGGDFGFGNFNSSGNANLPLYIGGAAIGVLLVMELMPRGKK